MSSLSSSSESGTDGVQIDRSEGIASLRKTWQFAAVVQFLLMFSAAVEYRFHSTEEFEDALVAPSPPEELVNLHVRMLRIMTYNRFVTPESWPSWFRKECDKKLQDWTILFPDHLEYAELSPVEKVLVLNTICEWQFDIPERFRAAAKDEDECRHWRVDPFGWDSTGGTYWLFDDNRLYRETDPHAAHEALLKKRARLRAAERALIPDPPTPDPHAPKTWDLLCRTVEDWRAFPLQFQHSKSSYERAMVASCMDGVGANVVRSLLDREHQRLVRIEDERLQREEENRKHRLEELSYSSFPKRSSRLEVRQLEQMERERMEMIERDARKGKGESFEMYETAGRKTRAAAAAALAGPPQPMDRQERLRRRAARLGEDSPIPETVLLESLDSADGDYLPLELEPIMEAKVEPSPPPMVVESVKRARVEPAPRPARLRMVDVTKGKRKKKKGSTGNGLNGDSWMFKCSCGVSGRNWDDGLPMISCEVCAVWQHIRCIEVERGNPEPGPEDIAKWDVQPFVCGPCTRKSDRAQLKSSAPAPLCLPVALQNGDMASHENILESDSGEPQAGFQEFYPPQEGENGTAVSSYAVLSLPQPGPVSQHPDPLLMPAATGAKPQDAAHLVAPIPTPLSFLQPRHLAMPQQPVISSQSHFQRDVFDPAETESAPSQTLHNSSHGGTIESSLVDIACLLAEEEAGGVRSSN
ncbi:hypothetical protein BC830DRAFT_1167925 [Chytriomyces sp. MP71]|nr:hypothetical protein BC830DRAFT_1167925 [Chytriomyces sp. MP71]